MLVHFLRHSVRRSSLSLLQNLIDWLTDWLTDRLTKFCQVQSLLWVIHLILLHFVFAISYWFVHTLTHTLFNCCVPAIPRLSSCTQWFLISIYPFHHLSLDSCLYMLKPVVTRMQESFIRNCIQNLRKFFWVCNRVFCFLAPVLFLYKFFCTSFLHWIECSSIWHKKVACTFPKLWHLIIGCIVGWRCLSCLLSTMFAVTCIILLMQESCTSVSDKFLVQDSWLCVTPVTNNNNNTDNDTTFIRCRNMSTTGAPYTRFMRWMQNSARPPPTLGPSPRTWAIDPPAGSYETIYNIAIIITQPESWYSFYHPTEGRRLSLPRWLVIYPDSLPTHEQSPIQVVTRPSVDLISYVDRGQRDNQCYTMPQCMCPF